MGAHVHPHPYIVIGLIAVYPFVIGGVVWRMVKSFGPGRHDPSDD